MEQDDKTGKVTATPPGNRRLQHAPDRSHIRAAGREGHSDRRRGQGAHREAEERNDTCISLVTVVGLR